MGEFMNEEVRIEAESKDIAWILTGITDNSEYGYREFVNNGLKKASGVGKKVGKNNPIISDNA